MICSDFTEHEMLAATLNLMANYVMKFLDIVLIVYEYMGLIEQISINKYATYSQYSRNELMVMSLQKYN